MSTEETSGAIGRRSADSDRDGSSTADNTAIVEMVQQSSRSREPLPLCKRLFRSVTKVGLLFSMPLPNDKINKITYGAIWRRTLQATGGSRISSYLLPALHI